MLQRVDIKKARKSYHGRMATCFSLKRFTQVHSFSTFFRLTLILTLLTGAILTSLFSSVKPAEAAALQHAVVVSSSQAVAPPPVSQATAAPRDTAATGPVSHLVQDATKTPSTLARPVSTSHVHAQAHAAVPNLSSSQSFDGLGDLPFYNYVSRNLTDAVQMKVNVANGNMVLHASEASLRGTGLDLGLDNYYNSEDTNLIDNGNSWYFGLGRGITIDVSNPNSGVTLHGVSGYSAFFPSDGNQEFKDAPGLNATLYHFLDGSNNYWLTFHQSGLRWLFNGSYGDLYGMADKNGNEIGFSYDNNGYLSGITDTQGRQMTVTLNADNQIASITDPANRKVTYTYDNTPPGGIWLTAITDANNEKTSFTYDSNFHITKITDPLNKSTTLTYNSSGQVATITDATGTGIISFGYHASSESTCSGIVPAPGPALPCTVVTDQNGHSTTYAYNSQLQVPYTKDALGHISAKSFDALNYNVTQYSDALQDLSTFTFGSNNNLTASADGNGATTSFGYPAAGSNNQYYPLSQTDPQNHTTNYSYDSNGNVNSATDASTNKGLTYTYNSNGTIATQKDANGNTTTYGYDTHGNLTSIIQPSPLGNTTLSVDALSRVSSLTDGNGHKTSYGYDAKDRVTTITYADGSTVIYTYDKNGNILTEKDATGTTTFQYDVLNRITHKILSSNGGSTITTGYDKIGNLTTFHDNYGTITYSYDAANRVISLTDPDGAQTKYGYDNANRKTSIVYPNATGMLIAYDKAGHETSNVGGVISTVNGQLHVSKTYTSYTYSYLAGSSTKALLQSVTQLDPVGQVQSTTRSYSYDSQSELTDAVFTNSGTKVNEFLYGYDANGNRTSSSVLASNTQTSFSYNAANELQTRIITQSGTNTTTNYTYDAIGNLTGSTPGSAIGYNQKDQTKTIGSNTFTYSGANQNDRVQVNSSTFIYSGLGLSSTTSSAGTTEYVRCSCGMLTDEHTPTGKKYYYLFDGLGSVVGMTDSSGNDVNRYDYDPYGNMLNQQELSGVNNPWKYAAGYLDSSTGLYKYGIRYYDPTTGRWTQRTPVGGSLAETLKANPYTYAGDNPVNEIDPSGAWYVTPTGSFYPPNLGVDLHLDRGDLENQNFWTFAAITVILNIALAIYPFWVSDELQVYIGQYLSSSLLRASLQCKYGATISYDTTDALFGNEPPIRCGMYN